MINRALSLCFITVLLIVLIAASACQAAQVVSPTSNVPTNSATEATPTPYTPSYPVTVQSCGQPVTFESAPKRALAFDTNMTEIMLALGLEDRMVGYWISGVKVADKYQKQIEKVPLMSEKTDPPPGMEVVLSFNPDFVFGAWGYNFSQESGQTPEKLAVAGIKSYVLSESCTASGGPPGVTPDATLESTYQDILNLGLIFGVGDRAQVIVDQMRANIEATQKKIGNVETPLRAFYVGLPKADTGFSSGRYGMVSKLMTAAGAKNILADVEKDWIPAVTWETVIARDPEVIVMADTPWSPAAPKIATLESLPKLASVTAIREKRFLVLPWTYIIPGVEMDESIAMMAKAFYPDRFR